MHELVLSRITLPILFSLERENITVTLQHLTTEQSLSQNRLITLKHGTIPVKNASWSFADNFPSSPVFRHGCIGTLKYVYKFTHASYISEQARNVCSIDRSGVNRYIAIYLFSSSLVREALSNNTTPFQHTSDSFLPELATKFNNCK